MIAGKKLYVSILVLLTLALSAFGATGAGAAKPSPVPVSVVLTSVTLDPEDAAGHTTNAPGAWSTNLADPLSQPEVVSKGVVANQEIPGWPYASRSLGEVSLPLVSGINTLTLYGTMVFPNTTHYGAVLFFDGRQVGPQIAVYNANGGTGSFLVQPPDPEMILGSANGGLFFDTAPGASVYTAPDGTTVEVVSYVVNSVSGTRDRITFYSAEPDGYPDTKATLVLRVTPPAK